MNTDYFVTAEIAEDAKDDVFFFHFCSGVVEEKVLR